MKRWTQLGLGTILAGGALAACSSGADDQKQDNNRDTQASAPVTTWTGGEGEGGVSIDAAATSPVVYNSALAIVEAHVLAARDAYALGERQTAAEMFAHPVSEVLHDMQSIFRKQGVDDFTPLLTAASAAALAGETDSQINAHTDKILAALRAASNKAPADGKSDVAIAAGVAVDQISRAADMYRAASESRQYAPYLDGYGFYKAGEAAFLRVEKALDSQDGRAADAIREALARLGKAYPSAKATEKLDADASELTAYSSKALLAISNL